MTLSLPVRYLIRFVALAYVLVLLVVPVSLILWRTFTPGFGQFVAWVSTPAAISALNLSVLVVAIVVPLNVIFGIDCTGAGAQPVPRKGCAASDHRPAVRSLAGRRGCGVDRVVGIGRAAGLRRARLRIQDHLRSAGHRARQRLRHAAIRGARG